MKILVIYTGGTIGSAVNENGYISPGEKAKRQLTETFLKEDRNSGVIFEEISPYTILSENLSAEEFNLLIKCVRENVKKDFGGIIIAHGTDTLQYSAAALSFTVNCGNTPVVFVSGNYPLDDERSNGTDNFKGAVAFIRSKISGGVFVSYKNKGEDVKIHIGERLVRHGEADDSLMSIDNEPAAVFRSGKIYKNENCVIFKREKSLLADEEIYFKEKSRILAVQIHPGDDYLYDLGSVKGIILAPYHCGTVDSENESFKSFCKRAKDKNIPVFLVNFQKDKIYESVKILNELNITVLPLSCFAAVYIKAWLGASGNKNMGEYVAAPLKNEFGE